MRSPPPALTLTLSALWLKSFLGLSHETPTEREDKLCNNNFHDNGQNYKIPHPNLTSEFWEKRLRKDYKCCNFRVCSPIFGAIFPIFGCQTGEGNCVIFPASRKSPPRRDPGPCKVENNSQLLTRCKRTDRMGQERYLEVVWKAETKTSRNNPHRHQLATNFRVCRQSLSVESGIN